jgi:hypothetical protein
MGSILAAVWGFLAPVAISAETKLLSVLGIVVGQMAGDEKQILVDAKTQFVNDMNAGKSPEAAFADGLTTFFNEEVGEVKKVPMYLFKAFGAQFGVPMA